MGTPTSQPTRTAANGVVYLAKRQYRPIAEQSAYRHTGRIGSTETIYAYVDVPVSHPFTAGTTVRLGNGRTAWLVTESRPTGVSLRSPAQRHRSIDYGALADLTIIPAD